jgi:hypothetical protein
MRFIIIRASSAIVLALACASTSQAQESSPNAPAPSITGSSGTPGGAPSGSGGGPASGGPGAAPEGPGLIARNWRSATDWQAWQTPGHWRFVVSPFSYHFRYSEEHRSVWAIGLERQRRDHWIAGASFFSNSFGQPSGYVYVGKRFPSLFDQPELFGQLSAGMMYGYRGAFQHKVPANYKGFSPGALVSMGWQLTPLAALTGHLLGDAGMMLQLSYELH